MDRETELKLDILSSLARSQKALACLIECISDIGGSSERMAANLLNHIDVISQYQMVLSERISGIRIRRRKNGSPTRPWLHTNQTKVKK